jgi:hypothetical protein
MRLSNGTFTTHHAIKVLALVTMTIDHVGAYLYPDLYWLRVVGRVSFPIFAFLIGHAPSHALPRSLWWWAFALFAINPFLGGGVMPLNALVTLAFSQWVVAWIDRRQLLDREPAMLLAAAFFLFLPSLVLIEYGTLGMLFALLGYAVRENKMDWKRGKFVAVVCVVAYVVVQAQVYEYSKAQLLVMFVLVAALTVYLSRFRYRAVTGLPAWLSAPMLVWSRHSMQYYVVHRLALQAAGVATGALATGFRLI